MAFRTLPPLAAALLSLPLLASCGEWSPAAAPDEPPAASDRAPDDRGGPPGAVWHVVDMLRESIALEHDPSDGGGRAWLDAEDGPPQARVGERGRFEIVYEVGPLGIAAGGSIQLQMPFWEWSDPQVVVPEAPGYTEVEPGAPDMGLEVDSVDGQVLAIRAGRRLEPGEQVRIVYGAGPAGASVDHYAERDSRFWIAVDGDGDGSRAFLEDSPSVDVLPGPPRGLVLTAPTIARPGEEVRLTLAVLDGLGNAGGPVEGQIALQVSDDGLEVPALVTLRAADRGRTSVVARAREPGVYRISASGPVEPLVAESNPILVSASGPRVLWADLHGHSHLSDGTGTPDDYYEYARDVAGLDVAALTDHDHWGILKLDSHPEMWEQIRDSARRFHEPGRFVTLLGYEWTSWIHGHRHVLYFGDEGAVYSSIAPEYESPTQLWSALRGQPALTFAHHSAGGPIPTNWDIPPDPVLEPVTEIVSIHGSSEALDSPVPIYSAVPGNFVRDALGRGYRFGFIGSGDSHNGHPGLVHLGSPSGGLAAILSEENTREGVLQALRERRVYATNGPRILLRFALGTHPMGSTVKAPEGGLTDEVFVHVVGTSPLEHVDLIRSGALAESAIDGLLEVTLQSLVPDLAPGEYLYVRAVQEDGGAAWSSPIYIE